MTPTTLIAAFLVASPAAPEGDTLAVRATAGTQITRSFEIERSSELAEMRQLQNGEEVPADMMPTIEQSSAQATSWTIVDRIEAAEEGIPTRFTRRFDTLEAELSFSMSMEGNEEFGEGMDESHEGTMTSPLVDQSVLFEVTDDGLMPRITDDSELEEEHIEGLEPLVNLAFLMPEDAVSEGDRWEVEPDALARLLDLGGELHFESEDDGDMQGGADGMMMEPGDEDLEPEVEGSISLTHAGYREEDGRRVAVVELNAEVTESMSFMPELGDMDGDAPEGAAVPSELEIVETSSYEGKGKLLFDLEAGIVIGLTLELDTESTSSEIATLDIPQMGEIEIESSQVEEGRVTVSYSASIQ